MFANVTFSTPQQLLLWSAKKGLDNITKAAVDEILENNRNTERHIQLASELQLQEIKISLMEKGIYLIF